MVDTKDEIQPFISHFRDKVQRLRGYKFHEEDRVFKKNILVSIIDALSCVTSNPNTGNRQRFTSMIKNFGDWPDHDRISAPHVGYLLDELNSPEYEKAREFIKSVIERNSDGRLVRLSDDPKIEEFKEVWPVQFHENVLGQIKLMSFSHLNLLYAHRNSLVHEIRDPGHGMEFSDDNASPYYHGRICLEGMSNIETRSLELVYPLEFYLRITDNVISNVERYLIISDINPYDSYQFGSSWIGELGA
ncbi:hypothetical protein MRB56_12755 [Halomonas cupida]|uniref:hypothetical protein n=1 Tax=Halomonas cupida TaxID=44933 RepID=UPI0039B57B83